MLAVLQLLQLLALGLPPGERPCPVVLSGPNYPVLMPSQPGLWKNLSGGFENGAVVKVCEPECEYHMIVGSWSGGTYSHDIIVQFRSKNKYNWTFAGQVAGCHWRNSTDTSQWWQPVPQPYLQFNANRSRWQLMHIWCIDNRVGWIPNCTIVRMTSRTLGRRGITGPWAEDGVMLAPQDDTQPWEDGELDSVSNPWRVGERYFVFVGSGGDCGFCVGLAWAANASGPFTRLANHSASLLINSSLWAPGGQKYPYSYNENPLVTQLPGSGTYVSVFDWLKPEVTTGHDGVFGMSYSTDGISWPAEHGVAMSLLPHNASGSGAPLWTGRARTPLSLIDEGDGTYTMFYTGFGGTGSEPAGVSFVRLVFKTVRRGSTLELQCARIGLPATNHLHTVRVPSQVPVQPPPAPPPLPPGKWLPWVTTQGVSVVVDVPRDGTAAAPLLSANVSGAAECKALCELREDCTMYVAAEDASRCSAGFWCRLCFGRTDHTWVPISVPGFVSARRVFVNTTNSKQQCQA